AFDTLPPRLRRAVLALTTSSVPDIVLRISGGTMRRLQLFGISALALLAFVASGGVADAQAPQGQADAQLGMSKQVNLSPNDELTQSEAFLTRMDGARTGVRRQLESARSARDVVKTLCLNDKLNQIDVAIRSARERRQALETAAQRHDTDLATHEFTILTVLRQRTEQLTAEANQCIGSDTGFFPASEVTATVDPNLPQEDPSQFPNNNVIVEPPACSSCFK
ncbi:MAG TPA: hypothetical protein VHB21_26775, partial [Minicystis sp.]|nr:hypothetical protein [Minicystis sp.]